MKNISKEFNNYLEFIRKVKNGKKAIIYGPGYVICSTNVWFDLNKSRDKGYMNIVVWDELANDLT